MKIIPVKIRKYHIIIACVFIFIFPLYAEETQEDNVQHYDTIKKSHLQEYNSGVYNQDKKDYVHGWINQDINYQKKAIKLKSDYLAWAKTKIAADEDVNYNEYISLKSYTQTEKEILLEYHNKHFKNRDRSTFVAVNKTTVGNDDNKNLTQNKKAIPNKSARKNKKFNNDIVKKQKENKFITGNNDIIEKRISFTLFIFLILIVIYYIVKKILRDIKDPSELPLNKKTVKCPINSKGSKNKKPTIKKKR